MFNRVPYWNCTLIFSRPVHLALFSRFLYCTCTSISSYSVRRVLFNRISNCNCTLISSRSFLLGLFNRVILQSGNALSPWALRCDHRKNAAVIGEAFDCPGVNSSSPLDLNSTALLDCLRELPFEQLAVIPSAFVVKILPFSLSF